MMSYKMAEGETIAEDSIFPSVLNGFGK